MTTLHEFDEIPSYGKACSKPRSGLREAASSIANSVAEYRTSLQKEISKANICASHGGEKTEKWRNDMSRTEKEKKQFRHRFRVGTSASVTSRGKRIRQHSTISTKRVRTIPYRRLTRKCSEGGVPHAVEGVTCRPWHESERLRDCLTKTCRRTMSGVFLIR